MELHLIKNIPLEVDYDEIYKELKIEGCEDDTRKLDNMLNEAARIARPKAIYACAFIDEKGSDYVAVEGIKFSSRVLSVNFRGIHRCFPYIATSGTEIEEWSKSYVDLIESFWADTIKQHALTCATRYLEDRMKLKYGLGRTAMMNPGSLPDWPIEEQRKLFELLNKKVRDTGVVLTDSCLMQPMKSVSGIRFETELAFENCMLCSRKNCPGRHAEYEPELFRRKYDKVK